MQSPYHQIAFLQLAGRLPVPVLWKKSMLSKRAFAGRGKAVAVDRPGALPPALQSARPEGDGPFQPSPGAVARRRGASKPRVVRPARVLAAWRWCCRRDQLLVTCMPVVEIAKETKRARGFGGLSVRICRIRAASASDLAAMSM